ncbi:MAG TPA: HEAT repeat domain-containing protein [Terriglobales bacterium]
MQVFNRTAALIILVPLLFKCTFSQGSAPGQAGPSSSGHFVTWRQSLQDRNIHLTEASLVAALQHPDPEIRSDAALVLAEDKASNAIGAIEDAAANEKDRETQINMALALALLGNAKGVAMLRQACNDAGTSGRLRMYAAKYTLDTNNEGCLSTTEKFLLSAPDLGSREQAISEIVRFQGVSDADARKILTALITSLRDPEPHIRMLASHALVALGNQTAVPELQKAIAGEPLDAVRSALQSDLQRLQEKAH